MFRRPLTWSVISLLCLAGAYYLWHLGNRWRAEKQSATPPAVVQPASVVPGTNTFRAPASTAPAFLLTSTAVINAATNPVAAPTRRAPYRVTNTPQTSGQMLRNDRAILLENALIDTAQPLTLGIPDHLRAAENPGAYIVQSRRVPDDNFRAALKASGASIVAYIPNNAYLVRADAAAAARLQTASGVQAVLPYEPYYKLRASLLGTAVRQENLPPDAMLNVLLFGDVVSPTLAALRSQGAQIVGQERSPFGTVARVLPQPNTLAALAKLSGVQVIELAHQRASANDRSRVRLGVSTNTTGDITNNYLGLTGAGILVNVTDSGVDATHPDLQPPGKVIGYNGTGLTDTIGHGTHVAGIIAGSGVSSYAPVNVGAALADHDYGSVSNANFRGMSPGASIFSLIADLLTGPLVTDGELQEATARTNALISNNSWGYVNDNSYSLAAASYDAAVRDALPGDTGSQSVTFVFAAGNDGNGNNEGSGGSPESITAPGTAKNVLTVGAIEQLRHITNFVVFNCVTNVVIDTNDMTTNVVVTCETNAPFAGLTDSEREVAFFSSRGNVGIGVEGDFGRFKPDVVAPGTFVVSTRSGQWDTNAYYSGREHNYSFFTGITLGTNESFINLAFLPDTTVGFTIQVRTNRAIPQPFPPLPIFVNPNAIPTVADPVAGSNYVNYVFPTPVGQGWFYMVANPSSNTVTFDLLVDVITTNVDTAPLNTLSNLNALIAPFYRFESGTSMSAAEASGVLALLKEFFEQKLPAPQTNSPALMKALLINGARSVGPLYDFEVQNSINFQGWGLIHLQNCIPSTNDLTGAVNNITAALSHTGAASMEIYEQNTNSALATGQSLTRTLHVSEGGLNAPLRVTLVWTDPPGNPVAGTKLVNDLDLIVTNLDTGDVYFGNDIPTSSNFTFPWDTNLVANIDLVNNVENIFIPSTLSSNYTITVKAHRVNVNAVTAHPNDVVQDYALVISAGDGEVPDALTIDPDPAIVNPTGPEVTVPPNTITNAPGVAGSLLFHQLVGANAPLLGTTNGMTNQWHFYAIQNPTTLNGTNVNFTNAAFVTFFPPTLAVPRIGTRESNPDNATRVEADIDLYVTTDPNLLVLDPVAIAGALKSRTRGGTEVVALSNAQAGATYYIGVKSEDSMAAEYAFLAIFSEEPFGARDENGNLILRGLPVPAMIPDGTPANPGAGLVFGIATEPLTVRRVVVTNVITHNNLGDLLGDLIHNQKVVALNNHRSPPASPPAPPPPGPYQFIYEDNGQDALTHTDGPGSLKDFIGADGIGLWLLTEIDDALSQTGAVNQLTIRLEPQFTNNADAIILEIPGGGWGYDFIDVPPGATNLQICAENISATPAPIPLELYVKYGDFPTRTDYDFFSLIGTNIGGTCIDINADSIPPLAIGRYFVGIFNPNSVSQTVRLIIRLGVDVNSIVPINYAATNTANILDDAVSNASLFNTNRANVASVEVGLRVDHPRVSDLAFTLVSPSGTRVLLMENRGRTNDTSLGSSLSITNISPRSTSGGATADTNIFDTGVNSGTVNIDYQFFSIPDRMTVYYDATKIFDSGYISGGGRFTIKFGPGVSTELMIVMNEGNNTNNPTTAWNYTASSIQNFYNYLTFTEDTNKASLPIKFATPPFRSAQPFGTNFYLSDFEVAVGEYDTNTTVNGWTILTNQVSVENDPANAAAGTSYGALAAGKLTRIVPTVRGRNYRFAWAHRGPGIAGWWRGEGNAKDSVTNNNGTTQLITYAPGEVGDAFVSHYNFFPPHSRISVPDQPAFILTNTLSIEGWINPNGGSGNSGIVLWRGDCRGGFDPYWLQQYADETLGFGITDAAGLGASIATITPLARGQWVHVAATLDGYTGTMSIFTNGVLAGTTNTAARPFGALLADQEPTIGIGNTGTTCWDYIPFEGALDEISLYSRAITPSEIKAIYQASTNGKFDPVLGSIPPSLAKANIQLDGVLTNLFYANNTTWRTNGAVFRAAQTGTPLTVEGLEPGVLLDNFSLAEEALGIYYFPEESLKAFEGEPAFGEWKLEIWDTRVGAPVTDALISWKLDFIYQNGLVNRGAFPRVITLTNGVPYTNVNCGFLTTDYYRYVVTTNAARAQFEINNPSGDMTLVAKKDLPLPDLTTFDYFSANPFTNDEVIVVLTNSTPVPLTPGNWFLGAINLTPGCVTYSIKATEWPVTGRPFRITHIEINTNGFCITWESLTNVHYHVEGTDKLASSNIIWTTVSPTITATGPFTTYCVPLPSPYSFFRVAEGIAINPYVPRPVISSIVFTNGGNLLTWFGPVSASYLVQWNSVLFPPPPWTSFTNIVKSTTGKFQFFDDGSQTPPGLTSPRFYRLLQLP
ncbi:MAG: hypothetical protein EPO07_14425 [Verrucomicrobia bacterium]|nr:MAG: hypothetical protein EPO07_14425 [Verrucomicrobiota bacterium]